jgi:hypothetical protein
MATAHTAAASPDADKQQLAETFEMLLTTVAIHLPCTLSKWLEF